MSSSSAALPIRKSAPAPVEKVDLLQTRLPRNQAPKVKIGAATTKQKRLESQDHLKEYSRLVTERLEGELSSSTSDYRPTSALAEHEARRKPARGSVGVAGSPAPTRRKQPLPEKAETVVRGRGSQFARAPSTESQRSCGLTAWGSDKKNTKLEDNQKKVEAKGVSRRARRRECHAAAGGNAAA